MDPKDERAFTPPAGMPGPREVKNRRDQAGRILAARGLRLKTDPVLVQLKTEAIAKALVAVGICTLEQLEYFFQLATMEALEQAVVASTPAPKIHVPGRDS